MQKLTTTVLLLLLISYCAIGQSSLLWKVEKPGQPTSYLFGTFHIYPKDQFKLKDDVKQAFSASEQLIMELDMKPGFEIKMMQLANMPDNQTLDKYLNEGELKLLDSALAKSGLNRAFVNNWRPFLITSIFYPSYIPNGVASFELSLLEMARAKPMEVLGLETIERQIEVFDKIPLEDQADDLIEMITDFDKNKAKFEEMVKMYQSEDVDAMFDMSVKELNTKSEVDFLLTERNKEWIPKLESHFAKPSFVAVGAGHLGGKMGVIALLRKVGYTVTPIISQE